ncbi:hypothetical protein F1880_009341 [Penicillium rolfsii]|nr:hypothetical protein F1880_009341 [Penicillium rolfsii]
MEAWASIRDASWRSAEKKYVFKKDSHVHGREINVVGINDDCSEDEESVARDSSSTTRLCLKVGS